MMLLFKTESKHNLNGSVARLQLSAGSFLTLAMLNKLRCQRRPQVIVHQVVHSTWWWIVFTFHYENMPI